MDRYCRRRLGGVSFCRQSVVVYGNVSARWNGQIEKIELTEFEDTRLTEAQMTFRKLSSEMRDFASNEKLVGWILNRLFRYNLEKIASVLMGYSNSIERFGTMRATFHDQLVTLLRIKSG